MSGDTRWSSAWGPSAAGSVVCLEKVRGPGVASQISALKETKDFKAEI